MATSKRARTNRPASAAVRAPQRAKEPGAHSVPGGTPLALHPVAELVTKDYDRTRGFIDKIDGYLFWIRNWSILSASGVIGFAVAQKQPWVLLSNPIILVSFWLMELVQKCFHEDALKRSKRLELILQKLSASGELPGDYQFGLGRVIKSVTMRRVIAILVDPKRLHNTLFYLALLLFTGLTAIGIYFVPQPEGTKPSVFQFFGCPPGYKDGGR